MASVKKFTHNEVRRQILHNVRGYTNPSNKNIDLSKTADLNYSLHVKRTLSDYRYYLYRKSQLYCYGRDDVKTLIGWIITAPKTLPENDHREFFQKSYDFLCEKYGEINIVQAIVHRDESQPHMHVLIIPVCKDTKHNDFEEKICCSNVITKEHLSNWHPEYAKFLSDHGISANVCTGITKDLGGNKTVKELKEKERNLEWEKYWDIEY